MSHEGTGNIALCQVFSNNETTITIHHSLISFLITEVTISTR